LDDRDTHNTPAIDLDNVKDVIPIILSDDQLRTVAVHSIAEFHGTQPALRNPFAWLGRSEFRLSTLSDNLRQMPRGDANLKPIPGQPLGDDKK
jgi:hypothetical protein